MNLHNHNVPLLYFFSSNNVHYLFNKRLYSRHKWSIGEGEGSLTKNMFRNKGGHTGILLISKNFKSSWEIGLCCGSTKQCVALMFPLKGGLKKNNL